MSRKNIVLFDMDGTLTEPRMAFDKKLLDHLRKLSTHSEIGILTGSDFDYLKEQMNLLIRFSELRYKTHLLPCNGTKHYKPPTNSSDEHKLVYEINMEEHLGKYCFKELIAILCAAQAEMCYYDFPLTGHFISYRKSMVNWSPVGRNATPEQRRKFIKADTSHSTSLRMRELDKLKHRINLRCETSVDVKLGGETSFDIFPFGWDKTYSLKHFSEYNCWFVGDRCGLNGNDKEIYDLLKKQNRAFETTGPKMTANIIDKIIGELSDG